MDFALLTAYIILPVLTLVWVRSVTWLAIALSLGFAIGGGVVALGQELGVSWDKASLQFVLLGILLAIAIAGLIARGFTWPGGPVSLRRQILIVGLPILMVAVLIVAVRRIADADGLWSAVTYFINQPVAEDNAKWLNFTSQLAAGGPISEGVPTGGPLQLFLVLMSTITSVISMVYYGGINEVFVAVWSALFAQYGLILLVPVALAPVVEARVRVGSHKRGWANPLIPWPVVWLSMLIMMAASFLVTKNGHLTLQFVFLTGGLWVATFVSKLTTNRARILVSLAMVVSAAVWLPLNLIAVGILLAVAVLMVQRLLRLIGNRGSLRTFDWLSLLAFVIVVLTMWTPLLSGLVYGANITTAPSPGTLLSLGGSGVRAMANITHPRADTFLEGLQLFMANGGTAITGPLLALLAGVSLILAIAILSRNQPPNDSTRLTRFLPFMPALVLVGYVSLLTVLDLWVTGTGPHYGALKMMFFVTIVVLSACLPFAIMQLDHRRSGLTLIRGSAVVVVVYLLVVDGFLPAAAAELRPTQWPMATAYGATYWGPAEIKADSANQTIASNPIGCVYLPQAAKVPTALPDGQRMYACTRILAGLSGMDTKAQPLVDWLRREWLGNTSAWSNVYDYLAGMPAEVMAKNIILLDEDNRVVGLESVGSLVSRFPKFAGKTPAELVELGVTLPTK